MRQLNSSGPRVDGFANAKTMEVNDVLSGTYQGSFSMEGDYGPQLVHRIQTTNQLIGLNGTTILNTSLNGVEIGSHVSITFLGRGKNKKGQQLLNFDVYAYDSAEEFEKEAPANTFIATPVDAADEVVEAAVPAKKAASAGGRGRFPFNKK